MTTGGIEPARLDDQDLRRELSHLHQTRHETVLDGTESALRTHTERMLALEEEFLRRFAREGAPHRLRTRAGSRAAAGQPSRSPGRDVN
jgi:Family of unknown function (DUF6158)